MTLEVPERLEVALREKANARGVSPDVFALKVLEQSVGIAQEAEPLKTFETGFGVLAKYGPAPSAEEIDANRAEMFRNFGECF
jgi:hypothetical protein